jgi:hypothetical protein
LSVDLRYTIFRSIHSSCELVFFDQPFGEAVDQVIHPVLQLLPLRHQGIVLLYTTAVGTVLILQLQNARIL